ncbi:MAG TPA: PVC-type heme-binding CxxCH protein, partial [Gemmataceae bacterium]|nr:PVC-type heme-binding CxxCH protein [Gemmataceae bacterium]
MMRFLSFLWLLLVASPLGAQTGVPGFKVPPGFVVTEFADHNLANDIFCMTVDAKGRIVVAGRGYIRILVDDDGDGRADRAIDFAAEPKDGAMGLCWEGDTLLVMGDGGLRRLVDKDGDGKADGPSELIRAMKTGGEHCAHALRRGPDGWLYVLCGNTTDIDKRYATLPTSPIKDPIAGCVLRFTPDFKQSEIVAHGFRNPYGMDFNQDGELFTFDSDNERCVSLPWYEPTRFYHVQEGGFYGWLAPQRANFWRLPPYFVDVVAPVAYLGRGSPTGVACYRHTQFPPEYHGGMFLCDWTFGKVHFATLKRQGASYESKTKVFLEATGDNGFAPTAALVHPQTGDLFIAIGGRGTRGAVYRVRYEKGQRYANDTPMKAARSLEWTPATGKKAIKSMVGASVPDRLWALQTMNRFPAQFTEFSRL